MGRGEGAGVRSRGWRSGMCDGWWGLGRRGSDQIHQRRTKCHSDRGYDEGWKLGCCAGCRKPLTPTQRRIRDETVTSLNLPSEPLALRKFRIHIDYSDKTLANVSGRDCTVMWARTVSSTHESGNKQTPTHVFSLSLSDWLRVDESWDKGVSWWGPVGYAPSNQVKQLGPSGSVKISPSGVEMAPRPMIRKRSGLCLEPTANPQKHSFVSPICFSKVRKTRLAPRTVPCTQVTHDTFPAQTPASRRGNGGSVAD